MCARALEQCVTYDLGMLTLCQDDGSFVMYYSASTVKDKSKHCVGAATSKNVLGPYTPIGSEPLFCDLSIGGAIDAAGFKDGNQRYVVYKVDGNSLGNGGACMNTGKIERKVKLMDCTDSS